MDTKQIHVQIMQAKGVPLGQKEVINHHLIGSFAPVLSQTEGMYNILLYFFAQRECRKEEAAFAQNNTWKL